jgi:hypothetical protein
MRIRDPKTTGLIFVPGKMVVTGSLACTGVGIIFYVCVWGWAGRGFGRVVGVCLGGDMLCFIITINYFVYYY